MPPPASAPPQNASSSSSSYPSLNKDTSKERLGGNIRVRRPTGAAAAAASAYEEEEPSAPAGSFDVPPYRIGIQELRNIFESAINKGKISLVNRGIYRAAYQDYNRAVKNKDVSLRKESLKTLQKLYEKLFWKLPKF